MSIFLSHFLPRRSLSEIRISVGEKQTLKDLVSRNKSRMDAARAAFDSAIANGQRIRWNRTRLMVLGGERMGKTATIGSLLGEEFQPEWHSTVGVSLTEVRATSAQFNKSTGNTFAAELAYRAAAHVFNAPRENDNPPLTLGWRQVGLGITRRITAAAAQVLYGEYDVLHQNDDETGGENVQVAGNGAGHVRQEGNQRGEANKKLAFEPKIGRLDPESLQMSVWDYGGQRVFYGIHHLFLSPLGIYLIVFDLSTLVHAETNAKVEAEERGNQIVYWLNCIHMYAPFACTMLIGTCLDKLSSRGSEASALDLVNRNLLKRLTEDPTASMTSTSSVLVNAEDDLLYYPISNKDGRGIEFLKRTIYNTAKSQAHTQREIPMPWMLALDAAKREKAAWVSLTRFISIARNEGVASRAEALALLRLCVELGTAVHLRMSVTLSEVVVTDAQWLVDQMAKVIRDGDVHVADLEEVRKVQLVEDWRMLFRSGLVSRDLLTFFWPAEIRDFLQEFMLKLFLISPWRYDESKGSSEMFLVPSMVRSSVQLQPEPKKRNGHTFAFEFKDRFLPTGAFERLVCLAVQVGTDGNDREPELTRDACRIFDSKTGAVVVMKSLGVILVCIEDPTSPHAPVLEAFTAMLARIKAEAFGPGLAYTVTVQDIETGNMVPLEKAKGKRMAPWFHAEEKERSTNNQRIEAFLEDL